MTGNSAPIRFGIFDWIDSNGANPADLYEERLKFLEYADAAGFYCYHLAEHQGTPLGMAPSPSVFLSAVAQRTRNLRFGPLVYPLPFYNPLRLLQEICMLDQLSRGRLEVGVGRGISAYELDFFNISVDQSREMFGEALDILIAGLKTGKVDYAGKYYTFKDVELPVQPWQRPYPPLWYPTANPDSIRWIAGEGISTVTHYPPMEVMREHIDLYPECLGRKPAQPRPAQRPRVGTKVWYNPAHLRGGNRRAGPCGRPSPLSPTSSPTSITCACSTRMTPAAPITWPTSKAGWPTGCTSSAPRQP